MLGTMREGAYIELETGEIVGPLKLAKFANSFPWRVPTRGGPPRCWDNEGNAVAYGRESDIKRVLSKEEGFYVWQREDGTFFIKQPDPIIPQATIDAAMEAGLRAKPAYEEFVKAIVGAAFANTKEDKVAFPLRKDFYNAFNSEMNKAFPNMSNDKRFIIAEHMAGAALRTIHGKLDPENESAPEKVPSEKTEVQSGLQVYRHKRRGTYYELLSIGKMQCGPWYIHEGEGAYTNCDGQEVAVYRSLDDGKLWVRPRAEFEDGRFDFVGANSEEIKRQTEVRISNDAAVKLGMGKTYGQFGGIVGEVPEKTEAPKEDGFDALRAHVKENMIEFLYPNSSDHRDFDRCEALKAWMLDQFGHHGINKIETINGLKKLEAWIKEQERPKSDNRALDKLDGPMADFLRSLHEWPLRVVSYVPPTHEPGIINIHKIEADYGQRGGEHRTVRIEITGPASIKFWK